MYIKRSLETRVKEMAEHFPVVLVCGARQVGKTTLLKRISEDKPNIQYVTLDHPRIRNLAKTDPGKNALKIFSVLDSLQEGIGEGAVLCMSSSVIPIDSKNRLVPIKAI
jgi:AAA+ ATPase superfamily predicted ATPase